MFPLGVITWRLGTVPIGELERIQVRDVKYHEIMQTLQKDYGGIFFLGTCQRIILAVSKSNDIVLKNLRKSFLNALGVKEFHDGEIITGVDALRHLSEVISSLNSITIGEDQIHYQFKSSYARSYTSGFLDFVIQKIIRLGKRVRNLDIFSQGKLSTISLLAGIYEKEIRQASSVGVIGTGKMGRGIIKVLNEYNDNIQLYSRNEQRDGDIEEGSIVRALSSINNHELLFLATDSTTPIVTKQMMKYYSLTPSLIFDLSMPRNSSPDVEVKVIDLSILYRQSMEKTEENELRKVIEFIDEELRIIIQEYVKYVKSSVFISLRSEIMQLGEQNKQYFIKKECADDRLERKYDLMIKKMMHISQSHIEMLIKDGQ